MTVVDPFTVVVPISIPAAWLTMVGGAHPNVPAALAQGTAKALTLGAGMSVIVPLTVLPKAILISDTTVAVTPGANAIMAGLATFGLTALKVGTATITITYASGSNTTITVTVT